MYRLGGVSSSYVDVPRINFAGLYRADVATANNDEASHAFAAGYTDYRFEPGWNAQGGGEFSLINCTVRSVTYSNGTTSFTDALVGSKIVINPGSPQAKVIGLDSLVPDFFAIVYGMKLALMKDAGAKPGFLGSSPPFVLEQDEWVGVPCASSIWPFARLAAHSSTVLEDVAWSPGSSEILQQMQRRGKELSVGLTLYNHCTIEAETDTLTDCENTGYLVGSIGVIQSASDPASFSHFGSNRIMTFEGVEQADIDWPADDPCVGGSRSAIWMYKAPFNIDQTNRAVRVAFGNAFSRNTDGLSLKDFGSSVSLAVLNEEQSCVELIANSDIPYRQMGWLESTAGMFDASLTDDELQMLSNKSMVVVRLIPSGTNTSVTEYSSCSDGQINSRYQLMLKENPYYVRPRGHYAHRLEAGDTAVASLYVTRFGQPSADTAVILNLDSPEAGTTYSDGIEPLQSEGITNRRGVVRFTFQAKSYKHLTYCGFDRMLYRFVYKVKEDDDSCFVKSVILNTCLNPIGLLLWRDDSDKFKPPYSWLEHVAPIFQQYYILYPVMASILNLSNFTDVIEPRNIRLLRYSMTLDFNHASYMPATRDLSPTKRNAILEWLDDPLYESPVSILSSDVIALCNTPILFYAPNKDACSTASFAIHPHYAECAHFDWKAANPSDLAGWQRDALTGTCTLRGLRNQLQQALDLEFATIPLYLTSMYSIKEGYNREVYNIIRTVVLQEMLHLVQVANLLIAVGGDPQIDDKAHAPSYPGTGLPGNVLPNLKVTLQKASREHIYEVFMALEHPHHFTMANSSSHSSIGDFYAQILNCIEYLHTERRLTFRRPRPNRQMQWPWEENDYGNLYVVTNLDEARAAIATVREQGEGSTPVDPTYSESDELGHFFLFEQIACGRRLVYDRPANRHSFTGAPVEFDPNGVWPMRDNPSQQGLTPGTQAYTVAWAFHKQYRSLLKQLQTVFDSNPEGIRETVITMETLTVYGKRAASQKLNPAVCDSETVGPVWDYEWDC